MRLTGIFVIGLGMFGAIAALCQIRPPAGQRTGPGVQAPQDEKEPEVLKACKTPPPAPGARGGARRGGGAPETFPRQYTVMEIPGVVAAGQQWKEVWQVDGNNADGIIATKDGGLLIAQNDKSDIVKLDKNGNTSVAYSGTNTGGSVAMNSKGALFVLNRGLNPSVEQLTPKRKPLANRLNDDPLDCVGGVVNDLTADSKGGVYFTISGGRGPLFYADPTGKVTQYGENLTTNGIVLSADEKHLWVTNGPAVAEFDVQKDGSLTNQREFAKLEGGGFGGDGSTFDAAGRLYVTSNPGVQVFSPDGKNLGVIPTPRGTISVAFSGPDRKTLYAVARDNAQNKDWILALPMLAQGPKGRGK
ncbi:MAG TPA: SMP-30/gluconolactonase/LRE family protein [Bryobacteraceae bacterium]